MKILEIIKHWANQTYLVNCYEKIGIKYESFNYDEYKQTINDNILPLLKLVQDYPFNEGANMKFSIEVETDGVASKDGYYPKGSFYRLSIHYSGKITEEMAISYFNSKYSTHQFFSGTYHFTHDMKLIKYQTHCDGMGKYPLILQEIDEFKELEVA
mgnify:CR=1 FL=1